MRGEALVVMVVAADDHVRIRRVEGSQSRPNLVWLPLGPELKCGWGK